MTYSADFLTVFDRIIKTEGGYINDPRDPGGETKFGISKKQYPDLDIQNLTREQAKAIYYNDYWMKLRYLKHIAVHYQVFDAYVSHGPHLAIQFLQRAVNVADDGIWGPISQSRYDLTEINDILLRYIGYRLQLISKLRQFNTYGAGWTARMVANLLYAAQDN